MKFDGRPVVDQGEDWLDVVQIDGIVARVRGYNEALVEVEAGEVAPAVSRANETTIRDRAVQALDSNAAFLAVAAPTNAQVVAQVKALTRQNNGLIRLLLGRFETAD